MERPHKHPNDRCLALAPSKGRSVCGFFVTLPFLISPRRILKISNHNDVIAIKTPPGGIVNLAVANPAQLTVLGNYVCSSEHMTFVVSSLAGVLTFFNNERGRVCRMAVKPFTHSWPRFAAVVKQVLAANALLFLTREDGIEFCTGVPGERGPRVFKSKHGISAPIHTGMLRNQDKGRSLFLNI